VHPYARLSDSDIWTSSEGREGMGGCRGRRDTEAERMINEERAMKTGRG